MKKFIIKIIGSSCFFLLFILIYIIIDPYKVVRKHKQYLSEYIMLDRGYVSTVVFLKNYKKEKYNSFIFGSSRSNSFNSKIWAKYLKNNPIPFSYGAWSETITGIYRKLLLIDSLNIDIKNVLIIFDTDATFNGKNQNNLLKNEHYLISGLSKFKFHFHYFKKYLNFNLILTSIDYSIFKKQRAYMINFRGQKEDELDIITNDWAPNSEQKILIDTIQYYKNCDFYERPKIQQYLNSLVDENEIKILKEILKILKKHNTNYKIVISPLYDQKKFNITDSTIINNILGKENIYDFSGINKYTNYKYNYYCDAYHYRKKLGNIILLNIYSNYY